ncbi:MAG: HEAT repeat domain-containing protein [Bacteroidota bacterium]
MTIAAVFIIVIISIGLIIQKIRAGINVQKSRKFFTDAQLALTQFVLAETDAPANAPQSVTQKNALEAMVRQLFRVSVEKFAQARSHRRDILREVMLDFSLNLTGETQARLDFAFQALGFVAEEMKAARSKKWWIRARACHRLRLMHALDAIEVLSQNLEDDNEDVRIEAALSLLEIVGVGALSPILLTIKDISGWMRVRISNTILGFGGEAVPHLIEGMKSNNYRVKKFCIEMLGRLGDVSAVQTLIEYMGYDVPEVQIASLEAFGKIGDHRAIPIIIKYAKSENEQYRLAAARALGNLGSPATVSVLNELLLHDTIEVRLAAAEALTKIGQLGIKTLEYSAHSENEDAKKVAIQFLHERTVLKTTY